MHHKAFDVYMGFLKSVAVFIFLVGSFTGYGQDAALDQIKQQFATYQQNTLQEKLYVHTDKTTYVAGELVWFKLYYLEAGQHTPLHLSKVAYIDVLDGDNNMLTQAKISLKEGSGNGSLFLPLSTISGSYKLRAYTAWMKNFGAGYFFETPLTIINTLKNVEPKTTPIPEYAVQIFPEGGNLVNGLQSKVAMQVTVATSASPDFYGSIITETGDTVAKVHSLKFGIGTFLFTPLTGHKYHAFLILDGGKTIKKELPQAYEQGYVMQLHTAAEAISISVAGLGAGISQTVYLVAHNRQKIVTAMTGLIKGGEAIFTIDTATLLDGITYITVFNEARQPVCERLYFKKPKSSVALQLTSDKARYAPRKKVELAIQSITTDTAFVPDLSLAVYRNDSLQAATRGTIATYLLLTSELSGWVEAPEYYFFSDKDVAEATENLMLTHGWRRFRWEQVFKPQAFSFTPEVHGHLIKVLVTDAQTGRPAPGINTFLSIPGNVFQFQASQSDSTGIAIFDVKNQFGAGEVILQTNTLYDSVYRMELLPDAAQTFTTDTLSKYTFSKAHASQLLTQSIGMQVQNIYRRDSLSQFDLPDVYDTIPFYGRPDYSYALDAYTRFPTMEEVLREYVRPINVVQRRGGLHLMMVDEVRRQLFDGNELVLLDGVPLFHKDVIFSYDPLKVKKLDVLPRKYFIGPGFFNGVASFTTYNGNYEGMALDPHAVILDYEGLQLQREFYAPVYQTAAQEQSRIPDFRSTLLWQPHIETKNGNATITFYTSDLTGMYTINIEGLNKSGKPVVAQLPIEVK